MSPLGRFRGESLDSWRGDVQVSRADGTPMRVSVVYLQPGRLFERRLELAAPATVGDAIDASGVRKEVAELATGELSVGTFGELRRTDEALNDLIFAARVRSQRTIPDGRRVTLLR